MANILFLALWALWSIHVSASPAVAPPSTLQARSFIDYAPRKAQCPSTPLVRAAQGLNGAETAYANERKPIANQALATWLASVGGNSSGFSTDQSTYPSLALASSGGGYRAMLTGAGVHQALDIRETGVKSELKGIYQALQYESGLSGGGWLLSALIGNNWPTISTIRDKLWYRSLAFSPLLPNQLLFGVSDASIIASISAKSLAGYDPTVVDVYGRFVAYTLLMQADGGVKQTLSSIKQMSNYANRQYPFPILTALEVPALQQCGPSLDATQFEFTPVEFGSWDREQAKFVPTEYTGSIVASDGTQGCVNGYDNLAYVLGTSSNIFTGLCGPLTTPASDDIQNLYNGLQSVLGQVHKPTKRDLYAPYPNTFVGQNKTASAYPPKGRSSYVETYLIDGGVAGQVNPIWPFLYRPDVDVLFVEDSGASSQPDAYPDGSEVRNTYLQSQQRGLTRMPFVPDSDTFIQRGYNKRPTFFGCDEPDALTVVYLPNNNYVFASNVSTFKLSYSPSEIDGMLANGQAVATNNGTAGFGTCVGCAVMKKSGTALPSACTECFSQYCATK